VTTLLTGATGFLGRHCLAALRARGHEVHAVARSAPSDPAGAHWHGVDLTDPGASARLVAEVRPSVLLHLAWHAVPGEYWASPENLRWVEASLALLREFARHGGRRVVMAGSCAEYDWRAGDCSESLTPTNPASLYGAAKHAVQVVLTAYGRQTGLSSAWARVFFVYGPHEHPRRLVPSVIRALLAGEPAECSSGQQQRDFLYVEDVADALVAITESPVTGPVNVGSGVPVAVRDLVAGIAAEQGGAHLIRWGARPAAEGVAPRVVADVGRLSREVGWRPRWDLKAGLRRTVQWWADQAEAERVRCG
jgi:nucleoside-diphosphate-sugar epimerase